MLPCCQYIDGLSTFDDNATKCNRNPSKCNATFQYLGYTPQCAVFRTMLFNAETLMCKRGSGIAVETWPKINASYRKYVASSEENGGKHASGRAGRLQRGLARGCLRRGPLTTWGGAVVAAWPNLRGTYWLPVYQ